VAQNTGPDEEGIFTVRLLNFQRDSLSTQNTGPDEEGIFTLQYPSKPGSSGLFSEYRPR